METFFFEVRDDVLEGFGADGVEFVEGHVLEMVVFFVDWSAVFLPYRLIYLKTIIILCIQYILHYLLIITLILLITLKLLLL